MPGCGKSFNQIDFELLSSESMIYLRFWISMSAKLDQLRRPKTIIKISLADSFRNGLKVMLSFINEIAMRKTITFLKKLQA